MEVDCFLIYNFLNISCNWSMWWWAAPISDPYQNIFDNLAYLKELLNYDWGVHWPPVSIHDIGVFCRAMLWQNSQLWSIKLWCYLPHKCTMNAKMIPALWFLLSCNMPSPQEYIVSCLPQPASTKHYSSHTLFHCGYHPLTLLWTKDSMRPLINSNSCNFHGTGVCMITLRNQFFSNFLYLMLFHGNGAIVCSRIVSYVFCDCM